MKSLADKIKALQNSRRGETLMESIAATLVFVILVAAVTSMIMAALRMTQVSTRDAGGSQDAANAVLRGDAGVDAEPGQVVEFIFDDGSITIEVTEYAYATHGYMAFYP